MTSDRTGISLNWRKIVSPKPQGEYSEEISSASLSKKFYDCCISGDLINARKIWSLRSPTLDIIMHGYNKFSLFINTLNLQCFNVFKWLYTLYKKYVDNECGTLILSKLRNNKVEDAKLLYEFMNGTKIEFEDVNLTFCYCCRAGYLEEVKWMYEVMKKKINIEWNNHSSFTECCRHNHIKLAGWLCDQYVGYYIVCCRDTIVKAGLKKKFNLVPP